MDDDLDLGPITPDDSAPLPTTPSNDWFSRAQSALGRVIDSGGDALSQRILSSNVRNYPPNSQGRNVQAFSTQGGVRQGFAFSSNAGAALALVVVAIVAVILVRAAK